MENGTGTKYSNVRTDSDSPSIISESFKWEQGVYYLFPQKYWLSVFNDKSLVQDLL